MGHQNEILGPPSILKRVALYYINTNQILLQKIKNKQNLNNIDIIVWKNTGGGNCFYKALSQYFL